MKDKDWDMAHDAALADGYDEPNPLVVTSRGGQFIALRFEDGEYSYNLERLSDGRWMVTFDPPHEAMSTAEYKRSIEALHMAYHCIENDRDTSR